MATEALWLVMRYKVEPGMPFQIGDRVPVKVFRTRYAARKYAGDKRKAARQYEYFVKRVTWGPEQ